MFSLPTRWWIVLSCSLPGYFSQSAQSSDIPFCVIYFIYIYPENSSLIFVKCWNRNASAPPCFRVFKAIFYLSTTTFMLLTPRTSIQLHSDGNTRFPASWIKTNVTCINWWIERISTYSLSVMIAREGLKQTSKKRRAEILLLLILANLTLDVPHQLQTAYYLKDFPGTKETRLGFSSFTKS